MRGSRTEQLFGTFTQLSHDLRRSTKRDNQFAAIVHFPLPLNRVTIKPNHAKGSRLTGFNRGNYDCSSGKTNVTVNFRNWPVCDYQR